MQWRNSQFWISVLVLIGAIVWMNRLSHGELVPIRQNLSDIPLRLGEWQGLEEGLEQTVIDILGVEDSILRSYVRNDNKAISLYVGYYESQRQGDTIHSPKHCMPGAGWYAVQDETADITLSGTEKITVNRYVIQKGLQKQQVLYWYQERGRIITSEYMAKVYLIFDAMTKNRTDGALVRIISPVQDSVDENFNVQKEFVSLLMPYLREALPE